MNSEPTNQVNLISLRAEVDAEIDFTESIADPTNIEDPDTEAYDIRLHTLRDAIEVVALYRDDEKSTTPTAGSGWSPTGS
jgi:hypothetical protein